MNRRRILTRQLSDQADSITKLWSLFQTNEAAIKSSNSISIKLSTTPVSQERYLLDVKSKELAVMTPGFTGAEI